MDREQAKVLLPIIQAFSEGKTIQSRCITGETSLWWDDNNPTFEVDDFDYRIKPEPKYRPFNNAEECWNEMQKHQPFGWILDRYGEIYNIAKVRASSITICLAVGFEFYNYEEASEFTFIDGTPFGIKE